MPAPAEYNPRTPGEVSYAVATASDAPAVAALVARVWTRFFGHSVSAEDLAQHLATSLHPDTIGEEIADGDMAFVIATVDAGAGAERSEAADDSGGTTGVGADTGASASATHARSPLDVPAITVTPSPSPSPRPPTPPLDDTIDGRLVVGVAQIVAGSTEPCLTHPNPVELRRLYVDQTQHGKGVADTLVAEAAHIASRRFGAESLWLGVWEDNPRARRFYSRLGFDEVGEHEFVVGDAVRRDIVMERAMYGAVG